MKRLLLLAVFSLSAVVLGVALAAETHAAADHLVVKHDQLVWGPVPPQFPAGDELAVMQGNPGGDGFYVLRVRMPGGYKIMPHWHPTAENVTVLSGTLHVAAGDKFDDKTGDTLGAGGYVSLPALMHHYAWSEGPTEIQIHGVGPFAIFYINPADDPSHMQK